MAVELSASQSIAIVLPDLRPGGAERLHFELARYWAQQGIVVSFVLRKKEGLLLNDLPSSVEVHELGARRVRDAVLPLASYLRVRRPAAVLAAMWPLTVVAPLAGRVSGYKGRIVISEHAPQSLSYVQRGRLHNKLMASSMRFLYPLADGLVAVSGGVADDMSRLSGISRDRFTVIHNPAARGVGSSLSAGSLTMSVGQGPIILSVGTLKSVKRYDLLIRSFAKLPISAARLCIVGEGPERAKLETLIAELGLQQRVLLPGYRSDVAPWYANANLFVLCSDYEGFGNVIVEALEHGVPVVSTDCPSGPREILEDGKYGRLVPVGDPEALAAAMLESLQSSHDHVALKARAQDLSVDKAADRYLDLLLPGWREAGRSA